MVGDGAGHGIKQKKMLEGSGMVPNTSRGEVFNNYGGFSA
jgi:hypothetical protein